MMPQGTIPGPEVNNAPFGNNADDLSQSTLGDATSEVPPGDWDVGAAVFGPAVELAPVQMRRNIVSFRRGCGQRGNRLQLQVTDASVTQSIVLGFRHQHFETGF
jgi:hypothetical protein